MPTAPDPVIARFDRLWQFHIDSLADRLGATPSVLLCMPDGRPLAARGLADHDLDPIARLTCDLVAASASLTTARHSAVEEIEIVQFIGGRSRTVVRGAPVHGHGTLLLSVTAEDVSLSLMIVQVRRTAGELATLLSAAG
ncbi:hypothetical protein [Nocardioides okcheonensis]|uniref:hypothetical protein n=1 Tax=Nocardioides okcheonensis TaxID=2894081 RepID=UPI001E528BA8|nr:hypothetical protein [Nocardioides okcheonensis]UFN45125.1 hypothetical protein LN652_02580 [Nocardioides okcheonensis]